MRSLDLSELLCSVFGNLELPPDQLAHVDGAALAARAKDAGAAVDRGKQSLLLAYGFGPPKEQQALVAQRIAQNGQDLGLKVGVEIDHDVAARHQIEAQERRIDGDVLTGEGDRIPQFLGRFEAIAAGDEIFRDVFGSHLRHGGLIIDTAPRHAQGVVVDVGGEDLEPAGNAFLGDEFRKHDSQRIGFLAGGAADHPDADFLAGQFSPTISRAKRSRVRKASLSRKNSVTEISVSLASASSSSGCRSVLLRYSARVPVSVATMRRCSRRWTVGGEHWCQSDEDVPHAGMDQRDERK